MEETLIENTPIRGITFKNAAWFTGLIITGMIACMGYVGSIKKDISGLTTSVNEINIKKGGDDKYNELQLRIMNQKMDGLDIQIKDLQVKYNTLLENQISHK